MADFDSTPAGLALEGYISGAWQDLVPDTTEHSITITSAEPPFKPARLTVPLWRQSGGLALPDFMPLRAWDPGNPGVAYPRYFQGFALNQQQGIAGNINQTYDLDAVGLDWLLRNPPNQIIALMPFGAIRWLPEHPHDVGDKCIRIATDGHMYEVTAATGDKMSGSTEPDFDTGTGAVTVDNDLEWTEIGSAYVTDVDVLTDLITAYFGAEVTFTGPNVLCADVGYFEVLPGMKPEDAIKSLAERVSEFAAVSFTAWVALTAYTRGTIVEPISSNGYGYLNIQDGTSSNNANIFNGHTTLGEEFADGSTRWVTFIQTNIAPTWQIVTPLDNAAHTAPWTGNFVWFDANNTTHVPTLSIEYSDQEVEDATHKHLSDIVIHRNGASGYANEVHVFGRNNAYGFAEDTVAQGNVQRVITTSYFMTDENGPDTNARCDIVANQMLGRLVVRETLTLESSTPLSTVVMQGGLRFGKVTMALLGLSAQRYPMTRVTMKMSKDSGSIWSYEWGDPFRGDLDQIGTLGGTRRFPGDHTPPALVTWPADYVLQNTAEGYGLVTLSLKWRSGNEADLSHFVVRLRLSNENFDRVLPDVVYSQQHIVIPGLPENVDAVLKILAYDTSRNPKPPITDANWSVSPPVTTAIYVASPPSALLIDDAKGTDGYLYESEVRARPYFKWTASNPLPLYYLLRVWLTSDPTTVQTTRVLRTAVDTVWPWPLNVGSAYTASIVSFLGGVESTAATVAFTVPAYTHTNAPTMGVVTGGVSHGDYYARIPLTHAGDHSGGGWIAIDLPGPDPGRIESISGNWTSPHTFVVKKLDKGVTYTFTAHVIDSLGFPSAASNARTYTPGYVPVTDTAEAGWDSEPADDLLRGLDQLAGSAADVTFLTTPTDGGKTTLSLINEDSSTTEVLGPKIAVKPGDVITAGTSRRRSAASGTATTGMFWRWFNTSDVAIGSDETIFSAVATTSFVYTEVRLPAAPALTAYGRWVLQHDASSGITSTASYFSYPKVRPVLTPKDFPTSLALDDVAITLSGTGSLIAGGGKVTVGADGITVGGSSGADNIDFVNEVDVQVGSLWAGGSSGNGSINLVANYNGAGSTTLTIGSVDSLTLSESAHSELLTMDSNGFLLDSGASTRRFKFVQGSVVTSGQALATNATNGFLYIGTCAGVPTGVPTTQLETIPVVFDSTNSHFYAYMSGAWQRISLSTADKARLDRIHTPVSKTATFTADLVSGAYLVSASGAPVVANLPAVSGNAGLWYFIKKTDSSTNTVTLEPSGAETIDGAANLILYTQDHAAIIYCDGATWWVFSTLGVTWRGHRINGTLAANGGLSTSTIAATRISKTAAFTAASETVYECDATSAAFIATLPSAASTSGRMYTFKKTDSSTNKITIDGNASETIDGIITYPLIERNQSVTIQSNGTNWNIIGQAGLILTSDGTRWLGPEFTMPMTTRATNSLQPYTANDWVQHVPWKSAREIWLTSWVMSNHVTGTNDGSNYWSQDLLRTDNDTAVATITTAAHGANSWEAQEVTSFTGNPLPTTVKGFELELIKTGSPGGIYPELFLKARAVFT